MGGLSFSEEEGFDHFLTNEREYSSPRSPIMENPAYFINIAWVKRPLLVTQGFLEPQNVRSHFKKFTIFIIVYLLS